MTKRMDAQTAGLTLLAMTDVPNMLAGMAPSLFTLQHFTQATGQTAQQARTSMNRAYVIGGGMSLLVGAGASLVSGSWWPFAGTVVMLVLLISQYEWALSNPHADTKEMSR